MPFNVTIGIVWLAGFVLLVLIVMLGRRTKRRGGTMTAAVGAVWDLQTDQKRKAIEVIVEKRAEARRPEYADGDLPELELPEGADEFSRLEFRGWQRVATKYDRSWSRLTTQFIPALLDAAAIAPGVRVLDVACGPGYVSEAVRQRGAISVGVDFSPEMIRLARGRCPEIEFRRGDAQALEFGDETFDAVVMNFGLLHLASPELAFAEAARVLRTGGRYAFTVWAGPDESPGARLVDEAIAAHGDMNVALPKGPDRFGDNSRARWQARLAAFGFVPDSLAIEAVRAVWHLPSASFLFDTEANASVRTAALLAAQTPETLAAIKHRMDAAVQAFADGDGFSIPFVGYVIDVNAS